MAFTFVVEDGTGLADANSYASVEEADDYLTANIHVFPKWTLLSLEEKQHLLVWGSRHLDQRADWNGTKKVADSGRRHPRCGLIDRDGNPISPDIVAVPVKQAAIEMAAGFIDADRSAEQPTDGIERLRVDVIEIYFDENYRLPTVPKQINMILEGLGRIRGDIGFGKIRRV